MKVTVLEGTPEEIKSFLDKNLLSTTIKQIENYSFPEPQKEFKYSFVLKYPLARHFSETKQEWVFIKDMPIPYLVNVLRKKLLRFTPRDLVEDKEYEALVYYLNLRLEEENQKKGK